MLTCVKVAADFIREHWPHSARAGLILGSGLGGLANQIECEASLPYASISHFPQSTAIGHAGRLVCGRLAGVRVVAMEGRCHFYEGYSCDDVTFPVRVMHELGAPLLIVSNASGGVNPQLRSGDIVIMAEHISWMGRRLFAGWLGAHNIATRAFYDEQLIERALEIARRENFSARRGVYVAVLGPNYETRTEYRCFRRIGGDVVGMSTVPEVLAAAQCGMRVLGLSVVTNVANPDALAKTSGQEVVDIAGRSEIKLRQIVLGVLAQEKQPEG